MDVAPSNVVPPPFNITAARNPLADQPSDEPSDCRDCGCFLLSCTGALIFMSVVFGFFGFLIFMLIESAWGALPVVTIGYVTVSLRNDTTNNNPANIVTSEWNVAFTVANQKAHSTLVYNFFKVSVSTQLNDERSTTEIIPGFVQKSYPYEPVHFNTTVRALMPRSNDTAGFELRFGVMFLSEVIEMSSLAKLFGNTTQLFNGTCMNMKIRVQGTNGITGGPVMCLDPNQGVHKYGDIW